MVKAPPCNQYPGPHSLIISKTGLRFCRKARQAGPKKNKPAPKPKKNKPAPKPKKNKPAPVRKAKKPVSPNVNQINIDFLRKLTANIPVSRLNRVGKKMYNKATHIGVYKTKQNMKQEANNAAARDMLPKQTLNQVRASRTEAIRAAQIVRRRLGLSVINR
jgi:hypothetical protein